ncbi:MAG: glutathione S-transferase [Gammaproteobacteria bacterium]|nr:glutathione S-transferase [Gammaproteobacteria bacterium]MDH5305106.1 glutathione S-transferase [Gammaproteobacteria bacterium]MDH5321773.1 glutathione S-transferase [Gammaproteobacteria bacterium]
MRMYDCTTAPSPRRVRIFAAEKGLDLELVQVDLRAGEQFSATFRAINPDCVVPVLELDDGSHLTEIVAICDYLEAIKPEPRLFGPDAAGHATALMWNAKVEQQGLAAMQDAFRNTTRGLRGRAVTGPDGYEQIPELAERGLKRVAAFYRKLDARLAQAEYLAGDQFTIADISALVLVDFAAWMKVGIADDEYNLRRWYQNVSARPSASA